jgi:hypothetical protein
MLGAEKGYELNSSRPQSRHVADSIRIHTGLVRHQSDSTVADQVCAVVEQDRDARTYSRRSRAFGPIRRASAPGAAAQSPTQESQ